MELSIQSTNQPFTPLLQCPGLNEAAQPDQQAEEVDQDPRGEDEAAAQVLPHRGEMPLPVQFLSQHGGGGAAWGVPPAQGDH